METLEPSDAEALFRSRRDPEAICVLYDRYLARLVAALAAVGGDREVAFDVAQETLARALVQGYRVRIPRHGSAWPWLWVVARNLLRDAQRRARVDATARLWLGIETQVYVADAVDELIARVDSEELSATLVQALEGLPNEQRRAVLGRVTLGLGYDALAEGTGVSEEAVRARVSRGLRALRIRLSGGRP